MILIIVMDIHPCILRTVRGIWDGVAVGIHHTAIGDGDTRHIIVTGTDHTIHHTDGVTLIIIHITAGDIMEDTMEDTTIIVGM